MRLIDADELKDHRLHGCCTNIRITSKPDAYMLGWNDAIDAVVEHAPTVDAVEVVRCKDCIYRDHRICYAHSAEVYVREDDYCSRGSKGRMSDFISREKLKDDMAVLLERNSKLIDEWLANCIDDVIDEQPTVDAESLITQHEDIGYERGYRDGYAEATDDVEPVRHGQWIWDDDGMDGGIGAWICSACHCRPGTTWQSNHNIVPFWWRGSNYCPNCGARMDVLDMDVGKKEVKE